MDEKEKKALLAEVSQHNYNNRGGDKLFLMTSLSDIERILDWFENLCIINPIAVQQYDYALSVLRKSPNTEERVPFMLDRSVLESFVLWGNHYKNKSDEDLELLENINESLNPKAPKRG